MPKNRRAVQAQQLYRDLAPDMRVRDRQLRVTETDDTHATCAVEHDLGGQVGRTARIALARLTGPGFELLQDSDDGDPLYAALLMAFHDAGPGASLSAYARAAVRCVRAQQQGTPR